MYMYMCHSQSPMHKHSVTYSADNFVSVIPRIKHFRGHTVILHVNIVFITSLRGVVGVNAKQVAAKQHHYTTDDHYGVDVRSRVSNQSEGTKQNVR